MNYFLLWCCIRILKIKNWLFILTSAENFTLQVTHRFLLRHHRSSQGHLVTSRYESTIWVYLFHFSLTTRLFSNPKLLLAESQTKANKTEASFVTISGPHRLVSIQILGQKQMRIHKHHCLAIVWLSFTDCFGADSSPMFWNRHL